MLVIIFVVPKVQFKEAEYKVDEADGEVKVMVYRSGDISQKSTVRCFTRQGSAQVMMDYNERPNTDASTIEFLPGMHVFFFSTHSLTSLLFIYALMICSSFVSVWSQGRSRSLVQ